MRINRKSLAVPALAFCLAATLVAGAATEAAAADVWRVEAALGASQDSRFPAGSPVVTLDREALSRHLDQAPSADRALDRSAQLPELSLPMPDGSWERFSFHVSRTMSPGLAARYPEIRAFEGTGRNSRWRARFELTPRGFGAMIWSPQGKVTIEPVAPGRYASAFLRELAPEPEALKQPWTCQSEPDPVREAELERLIDMGRAAGPPNGDLLRTYRLAVAATGQYTAQNGGTVDGGLAQVTTTVNRVNEVMGLSFAIALEIVPTNDLIIYTDGHTDPYSNGDLEAMLPENQGNLTTVIGSANYDIGHVFGTGGGGLAFQGCACVGSIKAQGASSDLNTGGERMMMTAAHEMGHQLGAAHTFNGDTGSCAGNRNATSAYEPGSGSTIMAYAGLCGSQNIQLNTHDYYHTRSYTQVIAYITAGAGSACDVETPTGNTPPTAVAGNAGNTIPLDTPFLLVGSATDADGDSLTYCWEQYNRGPAGHPDFPVESAPLMRSRRPKDVPGRVFPRIQQVLANNHVTGEILPFYARNMRYRLTVRDGLGGSHWDDVVIVVTDTAGPFEITSHPTAETLTAGSQIAVTWDVANTDNAEVDCQTVDILMAEDKDDINNYTLVLAMATPNDGTEMVTVPNIDTVDARIMVRASNNIFFDINEGTLTIEGGGTGVEPVAAVASGLRLGPARPNPFSGRTSISYSLPAPGSASLRVYDPAGRLVQVLQDGPVPAGRGSASWDGKNRTGGAVASGIYFLRLDTTTGETKMQKVHLIR